MTMVDNRSVMRGDRRLLLKAALAAPLAVRAALSGANARATTQGGVAADDPLRPTYHFQPPANWMNDPNGPIYWKGKYHLFYQYNPTGPFWAAPHWGHAVSTDMIAWRHRPVALAPTPGGADADGVFSGTALVSDGRVMMMYTAVRAVPLAQATIRDAQPAPLAETQMLATARDDSLTTWDKRPAPVIAAPPPGMMVNGFRDPSPWRQGDQWYMVIGCGIANRGGAVLLYRTQDLISWEYVKVFAERVPDPYSAFDPWEVWECPEFFALGDRHVLMFSVAGKAFWQSGRFDERSLTFTPERSGLLDYGNYYAPKTQLDADGNRILWGWVPETRPDAEVRAGGWAGMMSLPRILTLDADGKLRQRYLPALQRLRGPVHPASAQREIALPGCIAEAQITTPQGSDDFTVEICGAGEPKAWMSIGYQRAQPRFIWIDGRPLEALGDGEAPEIRLFIDGSVIEVSVNERVMWTRRFAYHGARRDGLLRVSGTASARTIRIWPISSAAFAATS